MLSSVRRRVLDVNDESLLVNAAKNIDEAYKETIKSARASWQENMNSLGDDVMPPTTSIDIEDYSDYKKIIVNIGNLVYNISYRFRTT